jgi:hypothetical protein
MSLLNKLQTQGSPLSNNGVTPLTSVFITTGSPLHNQYSLNGNPTLSGKPSPSLLDMNGQVPPYNYADNAPEGASF